MSRHNFELPSQVSNASKKLAPEVLPDSDVFGGCQRRCTDMVSMCIWLKEQKQIFMCQQGSQT